MLSNIIPHSDRFLSYIEVVWQLWNEKKSENLGVPRKRISLGSRLSQRYDYFTMASKPLIFNGSAKEILFLCFKPFKLNITKRDTLAAICIKDKEDRRKDGVYCGKSIEKYLNAISNMWDAFISF